MAKYTKSVSISGNWIKAKDVQNGAKAKIKSETNPVPSQFLNKDGSIKNQDVTKILIQGSVEPVNVGLNRATINGLVDAFGEDSTNWIDKVLTVHAEKVNVAGKRVTALYFVPEGYEVGEDDGGYIVVKKIGEKATPVTSTPTEEEISADDIPFN